MLAIRNNHVLTIKFLMRNGADPELYNVNGKTSFDYADKFGDDKIKAILSQKP